MKKYIFFFIAFTFLALFSLCIIDKSVINMTRGPDSLKVFALPSISGSNSQKSNSSIPPGLNLDNSNSISYNNLSESVDVGKISMQKGLILSNAANLTTPVDTAESPSPTISTITYTPKFVCGTISSTGGPIRPGYYD